MQIYNNWTRGGMKSEQVHFFSIFLDFQPEIDSTQYGITPSFRCKESSHAG